MTVSGAILSLLLTEVGGGLEVPVIDAIIPLGPQGTRDLLGMISSTMITVATTAFSIIIVALQLASGQLGPRLLRNFIRDRGNQLVFGTFLGTFVYSLLLLRRIGESAMVSPPNVAVLVALLLALASVGVLIYFIHHAATSVQKDRVIARVSEELMSSVGKLYPKTIGIDESEVSVDDREREKSRGDNDWQDALELRLPGSGYIQAVDADKLMKLARRHDLQVHLTKRPGDFVRKNAVVATVRPAENLDGPVQSRVEEVFVLGIERTAQQDVAFVFDQLLEIAIRALSPGITDSFTAMRCIDRITDALAVVAKTAFPSPYRYDETGRLRVVTHPLDFEVLVSLVLYPLAEAAAGHTNVVSRLFRAVREIGEGAGGERVNSALLEFNDYLLSLAQTAPGEPIRFTRIKTLHSEARAAIRGKT
jgi:uncharacterized membrane protein